VAAHGTAKLRSIQYLRAVAAVAVVVSHAANSLLGHVGHRINLDYGAYGVDVFFVVSGFVMFYTTLDTGIRPVEFLAKRVIRIFPLYFLLSTVMLALVALSPGSFNQESADLGAYIASIAFIPHWNPRLPNFEPIIGQGWTLNYEMFFYVLFAGTLFLRHRLAGLAVIPIIGSLVIAGSVFTRTTPMFTTYTSPLMLEFCFGVVVAATLTMTSRSKDLGGLLLIAGLVGLTCALYLLLPGLHDSERLRPLYIGVPCAAAVGILVLVETSGRLPTLAGLSLIGDASYSLYLSHGFVLGLNKRFWHGWIHDNSVVGHIAFVALSLALGLGLAIPLFKHIELPMTRALQGAWSKSTWNPGAAAKAADA
jgi:exopolysaccharide production protein ExoZ